MSTKPTRLLDWINDDDSGKYDQPSAGEQLAGHISGTNAEPKLFNWTWWRISQWIEYLDELDVSQIPDSTYKFIPTGTKMYFYQDTAPNGWTIDATPADALLAVKGGSNAYNVSGGTQAGTWTQPDHTHGIGSYAFPNHSHAVGTIASINHSHGVGTYSVGDHNHAAGTLAADSHTHSVGSYAFPNHSHAAGTLTQPTHTHAVTGLSIPNHSHDIAETTTSTGSATLGAEITKVSDLMYVSVSGGETKPHLYAYTDNDGGGGGVLGSTDADGNDAITGSTASDGGAAITGVSGTASTGGISGSTANTQPTFTGSSENTGGATCTGATANDAGASITGTSGNGATANTYRPLAQVGIICTKN